MQMGQGVEWAIHSCLNLAWVEPGEACSAAQLAAFFALPAPYLNKQLQALVRAGILTSTSGPRGGFRLARDPDTISLLDIVTAIEGAQEAFRCQQLLKNTPGARKDVDYRKECLVAQAMRQAELAWRRSLAGQTIGDIKTDVEKRVPDTPELTRSRLAELR
ncbi:BadM/Rrf2 family transcriptional regulator [Nocardia tenerifensis]|uniref:BadM/Rrf2 family transcriptional regulator n=2 Tax=Nocardia tenerifensis TaxID=228006 RepID=A0A318K992_9NOCA|nr:BadM/Rrf2 family transcriptional regulator [Nocardia tenerifensis]